MINPEINKMLIANYSLNYNSLYSFRIPIITIDINPGIILTSNHDAKVRINKNDIYISSLLIEEKEYNTVLISLGKYNSCINFIFFKLDQKIKSNIPLLKSMIKNFDGKNINASLLTDRLLPYEITVKIQQFQKLKLNHYKIYYPLDNSKNPKKEEIQKELKEINDCIVIQYDVEALEKKIDKMQFQSDSEEEYDWIKFFKKGIDNEYINYSKFNLDLNSKFKSGINIMLDSSFLQRRTTDIGEREIYYLNQVISDLNYNVKEWVEFDANNQVVLKKEKQFNTTSKYFNSLKFLHVIDGSNIAYIIEHIDCELVCSITELSKMRPEDWLNLDQI